MCTSEVAPAIQTDEGEKGSCREPFVELKKKKTCVRRGKKNPVQNRCASARMHLLIDFFFVKAIKDKISVSGPTTLGGRAAASQEPKPAAWQRKHQEISARKHTRNTLTRIRVHMKTHTHTHLDTHAHLYKELECSGLQRQ